MTTTGFDILHAFFAVVGGTVILSLAVGGFVFSVHTLARSWQRRRDDRVVRQRLDRVGDL